MSKSKQRVRRTDEELHPYDMFPYRLEHKEGKNNKICRFTDEIYLRQHIERYKIKGAKISCKKGWDLAPEKPKRKPSQKPSDSNASKVTKAKKSTKPATTTKRTRSTGKNTKILDPLFSSIESFHK